MNASNAWIYTTLQAGSALTTLLSGTTAIYNLQAPDGAVLPYVVFNLQGGGDENQVQRSRMKNLIYYVRAYAASAAQAGSIDIQIDALLHRANAAPSGYQNISCWREQDIELVEVDPSKQQIYSSGGLYRMRVTKIA